MWEAPLPQVLTLHLQVVRLRNVEQVVSVGNLKLVCLSLFVYDRDMASEHTLVSLAFFLFGRSRKPTLLLLSVCPDVHVASGLSWKMAARGWLSDWKEDFVAVAFLRCCRLWKVN